MRSPFVHIILVTLIVGFFALSMYDVKYISGSSMSPSLNEAETVIIYRWAYGLQLPFVHRYLIRWRQVEPGELVYLRDPVYALPVIKRCIAVGNMPIQKNNRGILLGNKVLEHVELHTDELAGLNRVPQGKVFLLGDNQSVSFDSRYYGFVDEQAIEGRVIRYR